jgi:hypothetical protein
VAATKVQLNWKDVSFGATALTGIQNVSFSTGGKSQRYSADDDRFPRLAVQTMAEPTAKVDSSDAAALMALNGMTGDFTATHQDAKKQTGGDIQYTLTGAVVESVETSGAHGAWGTASMNLFGVSADGQTNPLSFTLA